MRKFTVTVNGQDYDVVVKDSGAAAAPAAAAPAAAPAPKAAPAPAAAPARSSRTGSSTLRPQVTDSRSSDAR